MEKFLGKKRKTAEKLSMLPKKYLLQEEPGNNKNLISSPV